MTRPATNRTRRNGAVRCAIYTRKSSEEGLEQEFNSLQAQREACEAFINSQRHEGWVCLPKAYDDGGFSGATTDRPALQRLLADIAAGRVDTIVVYKIDRLTRSLADFAKIVEILDARGASFVSVTQQFNTTTSMGRLTLNVLLSFAQRARGHRRAHPRQDRCLETEGDVDGGHPAARLPGAGRQARHHRARGRARSRHFLRLCRTRLGPVIEGRIRSSGDQEQVVDKRFGSPRWRQAILARCALPNIAEPPLSRPDRAQGSIPSRRTHPDHRSAFVGCGPGAARRQYRRPQLRDTHSPAEPARRHAVRRRRQSHDANPCDQGRETISLLHLPTADHQRSDRWVRRPAHPGRGTRASGDQPHAAMAYRSRQRLPGDPTYRSLSAASADPASRGNRQELV